MGWGMWWLPFRGLYLIFPTVVTLLPPVPRNPHSCSSNLQRLFELYIWGLEKWPWLGLWTQGRQWESDPDRSSFITGHTHLCSNKGAQGPASGSQLRESSNILCPMILSVSGHSGPSRVWLPVYVVWNLWGKNRGSHSHVRLLWHSRYFLLQIHLPFNQWVPCLKTGSDPDTRSKAEIRTFIRVVPPVSGSSFLETFCFECIDWTIPFWPSISLSPWHAVSFTLSPSGLSGCLSRHMPHCNCAPLLLTKHHTAAAKSLQSCLTLCDPIDGSPWGSPVPGILQARTLEWVAISFSNA